MTRITTLATSDQMTAILGRTQQRMQDLQTQITTGPRAQSYAGIAAHASRPDQHRDAAQPHRAV